MPRQGADPNSFPGGRGNTMSRLETTRRQRCDKCGEVTLHEVTIYDDDPREILHCTECDQ